MLHFLALTALAVGVFYVAILVTVFLRQDAYLFVPDRSVAMTPAALNMAYAEVRLATSDGETIAGWFVPAFEPDRTPVKEDDISGCTVLICHGNGGDIGDRLATIRVFHHWRMNVFIFDYRGYGNSTGRPSEEGTHIDARTAWHYLTQTRAIPPQQILIYGRSMGTAVATRLAVEVSPHALVLESGFTSVADMAAHMFPFLPTRLISRSRYPTIDTIRTLRCPVLIAHSPADEVIPFAQGRRLFEAAKKPKLFVELSGGHNTGGFDNEVPYQRTLHRFLIRHLGQAGAGGTGDKER